MQLKDACLILLAGGRGTRVQAVYPDLPKPLIPIAGRPFIEWMLLYWASRGLRRVIVSLGHLAEVADKYFQSKEWSGLELWTVREGRPLGTGGAIRFAAAHPACSDPFIVANADSLTLGDFSAAWPIILQKSVDGVILGQAVADAGRYGSLRVDAQGRLLGFSEKRPGRGLINAGVYLLKKKSLERFPAHTPMSVEREAFPALLAAGLNLRVHIMEGDFLDMGTPEDLERAPSFIDAHRRELEAALSQPE